jgi:hypothetical protein
MIRWNLLQVGLLFLAAAGLAVAQDQLPPGPPQQAPPSNGGWRRVGDAPPAAPAQSTPESADRSDAYGQPIQAPQDQTPVAPPPDQQIPQTVAPAQTTPAYGIPPTLTLKGGTYVTIRTNQFLSTDRNQPGDAFSGTLVQPVVVDGIVVADRGQTVYGRISELQKHHVDKPSRLGLQITGITLVDGTQAPVQSQLVSREGTSTPGGVQAGAVVGTTAVGAAIGGAAAWGTGAAIGAGAGAVAGIIGVLVTRNHPTVLYPETALTFQIQGPVQISTAHAPQAFRYVGPEDYNQPANGQLMRRPAPGPGYPYAPGYAPGYAYAPGYYPPYPYPYPYYGYYWGPGIGFVWGPRFYYGRGFYGRWR